MDARTIDEMPLMKLLSGIILEDLPALGAKMVGGMASAVGQAADATLGYVGDKATAFGSAASLGSSGPEITPARVVAPAIEPARAQNHEVDMAELGTFAPNIGFSGGRSSGGVGVA